MKIAEPNPRIGRIFDAILLGTCSICIHTMFHVASSDIPLNIDVDITMNVYFAQHLFSQSTSILHRQILPIFHITFHNDTLLGGASVNTSTQPLYMRYWMHARKICEIWNG